MTAPKQQSAVPVVMAALLIGLLFGAALGASFAGRYFQRELAATHEAVRLADLATSSAHEQVRQCLRQLGRRP